MRRKENKNMLNTLKYTKRKYIEKGNQNPNDMYRVLQGCGGVVKAVDDETPLGSESFGKEKELVKRPTKQSLEDGG